MGRKAKEAAQQKITSFTKKIRHNAATSKAAAVAATTTTPSVSAKTKQDAIVSDENRTPLQNESQNVMDSLKECSVRLERLEDDSLQPVEMIDKQPEPPKPVNTNVYDYSFDMDATPLDNGEAMQDLFAKMAKENRIEVKKYKPKAARQVKKKTENSDQPKAVRKRRLEKPKTTSEPPAKKPNHNADAKKIVETHTAQAKPVQSVDANRNKIVASVVDKENLSANVASSPGPQTQDSGKALRSNLERLRNLTNLQSSLKSSTPLKPLGTRLRSNSNNTSLNLSALGLTSPIIATKNRSTPLAKPIRQPQIVNENQETSRAGENAEQSIFSVNDMDSMVDLNTDFEPIPSTSGVDKENPTITSNNTSVLSNRTNRIATPLNDSSSFNIYSPTKRRVYGRSPLKNIVSSKIQ